jgi:hypothetical protein
MKRRLRNLGACPASVLDYHNPTDPACGTDHQKGK